MNFSFLKCLNYLKNEIKFIKKKDNNNNNNNNNSKYKVIEHKQNQTCLLTDMRVPSVSNISAKEFEKLSKYKDLKIEIAKMWKMETKTIPVIMGALGMIKKGTQKYVNEILGNLSLAEIQKLVLNSSTHDCMFLSCHVRVSE